MTLSSNSKRPYYPALEFVYMDEALAEEIRVVCARIDRRKRLVDQGQLREESSRRGGFDG